MVSVHAPTIACEINPLAGNEYRAANRDSCELNHWYQVPAIDTRGTFKVRDMVSDMSLMNMYVAGKAIKGV